MQYIHTGKGDNIKKYNFEYVISLASNFLS